MEGKAYEDKQKKTEYMNATNKDSLLAMLQVVQLLNESSSSTSMRGQVTS